MASKPSHAPSLFIPSIADCVMLIVAVVTATTWSRAVLNTDGDAGRHIRVGETILAEGLFYEDRFSHTMAGERFVPYEWLSEVLTALAHRIGGLSGLVILTALLVAVSWGLLALFLRRSGVDPLLAFITCMAAGAASAFHWLARPHVYTFLGTILLLWLMERGSRRAALWVGLLFAVWANLHGGFLFGLVLIAMYLAGDALELWVGDARPVWRDSLARHVTYLAAAVVGASMTPSGLGLFAHVTGYLGETYLVAHTNEYMSPDFHVSFGRAFLLLLLTVVAGTAHTERRPSYPVLIVLLGTLGFALHSARNIPLFCLTALPLVVVHLDPEWRRISLRPVRRLRLALAFGDERARAGGWAVAGVVAFAGLGLAGGRVAGITVVSAGYDPAVFPIEAVSHSRAAGLGGRLFNEFTWGGYILYAWPEQRVFIDGQTDFYGEALTREYREIVAVSPGWDRRLRARQIRLLLIPSSSPLAYAAATSGEWDIRFCNDTAVLLAWSGAVRAAPQADTAPANVCTMAATTRPSDAT